MPGFTGTRIKDTYSRIVQDYNGILLNALGEELTSSIHSLHVSTSLTLENYGDIGNVLDSLFLETGSVSSSLNSINTTASSHEGRLDSIESITGSITSFESRLENVELSGSDHETRIDNLEATGSTYDVASFSGRLDDIETVTASLESDVITLYSASSSFASDIDTLFTTTGGSSSLQAVVDTDNTSTTDILMIDGAGISGSFFSGSFYGNGTGISGLTSTQITDFASAIITRLNVKNVLSGSNVTDTLDAENVISGSVSYSNIDTTLKGKVEDNDGTWDFSAAGIISASFTSGNTDVTFSNLQETKTLTVRLHITGSATFTLPSYCILLKGSSDASGTDGTYWGWFQCISNTSGSEEVVVSILEEN